MSSIPADQLARHLKGSLGQRQTRSGLSPRRLPAWAEAQNLDASLDLMAGMTSGVRLEFQTTSRTLGLTVLTTGLQILPESRRTIAFDLLVEGVPYDRATVQSGSTVIVDTTQVPHAVSVSPGEPCQIDFARLPPGSKRVEIWLPQSALVDLHALQIDPGAGLETSVLHRPVWAHYGSSISHGMDADGPSGTWPAVAAQILGLDLLNLGFAGQCHLDGFVARAIRDARPDLISLKLGVNVINLDSMRERTFAPAVHAFLDTLREGLPDTPVLVLSPILCPMIEDRPGPTLRAGDQIRTVERPTELAEGALTLGRIRALLSQIIARRQAAGDANLFYQDGRDLFDTADLADLPDGLHPNPAGLDRMGRRFAVSAPEVFRRARNQVAEPLPQQAKEPSPGQ
ncbi:MAG: SGNH/GDSL hydrolase family protein [Caulobacter sp.]|nr:SGNH/GDSL hydrolase family protein [Caulobacter sp.]